MPTFSNLMVLTGAGFTKNFGGYLSSEMWTQIFNQASIQSHDNIRALLLEDLNFENVYSVVMEDSENTRFSKSEQVAFMAAIESAFQSLDKQVMRYSRESPDYFPPSQLGKLAHHLSKYSDDERALWFTLNQDIFLERRYQWRAAGAPQFQPEFYRPGFMDVPVPVTLPSPQQSQEILYEQLNGSVTGHVGPSYIKLHGSYCWQSWTQKPGMILGVNKETMIEDEPLLKCYFDLFKSVIQDGGRKLLIIGYGFRDLHVNRILLDGVMSHKLELFIINPSGPDKFKKTLKEAMETQTGTGGTQKIWDAVRGYFPYTLQQIFRSPYTWPEIESSFRSN